jgi:hypothetical protein
VLCALCVMYERCASRVLCVTSVVRYERCASRVLCVTSVVCYERCALLNVVRYEHRVL